MTNIKERILLYAKSQGFVLEKFFKELDITYSSFKGSSKAKSLNSDAIEKILSKHRNLNPYWLILNEGEMLIENDTETRKEITLFQDLIIDSVINKIEEMFVPKTEFLKYAKTTSILEGIVGEMVLNKVEFVPSKKVH